MVLLSMNLPALASVRDSTVYDYEWSGVFTWGDVITALCRDGWCRTQLPRDFFELKVPLNVYEKGFNDAFRALSMQALADGYRLTKTGSKRPYTVKAELDEKVEASYISCEDTSVRTVEAKDLSKYRYVDSLKCVARNAARDSARLYNSSVHYPALRYRVSFYVVSSSFLRNLGIEWTDIWARGNLVHAPEWITDWALKAVASDDTTAEFRSIEVDLDSSTTLHWGSQRKEEKSIVTYSNGVSQQDYEWRNYGLTLTLTRDTVAGIRADYTLAQRDENNSVLTGSFGGGGMDSVSAWGVYDSYQRRFTGIPWLYRIPYVGYLFGKESRDKVKSFFVIEVYPIEHNLPNNFPLQDSLRIDDIRRYENVQDSSENQPDSLDNIQSKEALDEKVD